MKLSDLQIAIAVTVLTVFFGGCAGVQTTETKSLLGSAGFRELTPKTEKQKQTYAELPANKIERVAWRGTTLYIYKDAAAGVAYVGRQAEYDRYQQLCRQRHMDQDFFAAEQADPLHAHRWYGAWSPNVVWR